MFSVKLKPVDLVNGCHPLTVIIISAANVFFCLFFPDERQDVQKKTFTKWVNSHLMKTKVPPVKDLFKDLQDGHKLLALLGVLTNKQLVSWLFFFIGWQWIVVTGQ